MGNISEQGNHRGLPLRETAVTGKIRIGINHGASVGAGPCACPVPITTGPRINPKNNPEHETQTQTTGN